RKEKQKLPGNRLLAAMCPILIKYKVIRSADLQKMLAADKDSEWADYHGRGRPITPREISLLLDDYEIDPNKVDPPGVKPGRGYKLEWFIDTFRRYLPRSTVQAYPELQSKPKSTSRKKPRK